MVVPSEEILNKTLDYLVTKRITALADIWNIESKDPQIDRCLGLLFEVLP